MKRQSITPEADRQLKGLSERLEATEEVQQALADASNPEHLSPTYALARVEAVRLVTEWIADQEKACDCTIQEWQGLMRVACIAAYEYLVTPSQYHFSGEQWTSPSGDLAEMLVAVRNNLARMAFAMGSAYDQNIIGYWLLHPDSIVDPIGYLLEFIETLQESRTQR